MIELMLTMWLVVCAWLDWRTRRVSNWLTMPVLGFSVLWAIWNWKTTLIFWILTAIVMLLLWWKGGTSGADVKIVIALSSLWPLGLLIAAITTSIYTFIMIKSKGKSKIYPAVVPIALGAVVALFVQTILLNG